MVSFVVVESQVGWCRRRFAEGPCMYPVQWYRELDELGKFFLLQYDFHLASRYVADSVVSQKRGAIGLPTLVSNLGRLESCLIQQSPSR